MASSWPVTPHLTTALLDMEIQKTVFLLLTSLILDFLTLQNHASGEIKTP
jgi:hypothetical protein